jgi:hypothetical protein
MRIAVQEAKKTISDALGEVREASISAATTQRRPAPACSRSSCPARPASAT